MGTIVIHAGMPKTGSTSLQVWLGSQARRLRRKHDVQVLVARPRRRRSPGRVPGAASLRPPWLGTADSTPFAEAYAADQWRREELARALFAQLDARARDARTTVLSSEALAGRFWRCEEAFLAPLGELAERHEVRVAYYVRPQHEALEAAWRQWGFRASWRPSRWIARRARRFHYCETLDAIRERVPGVSFEPRPYRADLLTAASTVGDFAAHFLGLAPGELAGAARSGGDSNPGVPLEVANMLRGDRTGRLWSSRHDNRRLEAVKALLADVERPESPEIRRSRLILRDYAHRTFEPSNRRLIAALGWDTESFVAAVDGDDLADSRGLDELDDLWRPSASEAELALVHSALARAVSARGLAALARARLRAAGRGWERRLR